MVLHTSWKSGKTESQTTMAFLAQYVELDPLFEII